MIKDLKDFVIYLESLNIIKELDNSVENWTYTKLR